MLCLWDIMGRCHLINSNPHPLPVFCLFFQVVELMTGGAQTPVTNANKIFYLNLLAQYRLASQVKEEVEHFLKGGIDLETERRYRETQRAGCGAWTWGSWVCHLSHRTSSLGIDWKDIGWNPPVAAFEGIWSNNSRLPDFLLKTGRSEQRPSDKALFHKWVKLHSFKLFLFMSEWMNDEWVS